MVMERSHAGVLLGVGVAGVKAGRVGHRQIRMERLRHLRRLRLRWLRLRAATTRGAAATKGRDARVQGRMRESVVEAVRRRSAAPLANASLARAALALAVQTLTATWRHAAPELPLVARLARLTLLLAATLEAATS